MTTSISQFTIPDSIKSTFKISNSSLNSSLNSSFTSTISKKSLNSLSLRSLSLSDLDIAPPSFITDSKIGLISYTPELSAEGTGGTYFMKNHKNKPVAVFKPQNEDPLSLQNPKRKEDNTDFHFKGILPGEGVLREVLASQIDYEYFSIIPETHLAEISHWIFTDNNGKPGTSYDPKIKTKLGSLQEFIPDIQCTVDDMGYGKFSLEDVQKIAMLDLLLLNCDRNGGNILVRKYTYKLVPIDHAFSLPDYHYLSDLQWFEWLTWRQVKQPIIPLLKSFIKTFNLHDALIKARKLGIREECLISLQLSYIFLLYAFEQTNLTLYDIGKLMCHRFDKQSEFEKLVNQAIDKSNNESNLLFHFTNIIEQYFLTKY